jgi:hypothetical protein
MDSDYDSSGDDYGAQMAEWDLGDAQEWHRTADDYQETADQGGADADWDRSAAEDAEGQADWYTSDAEQQLGGAQD